MPSFTASAPGKIILFGEHAVVYGQPAIAVPVTQVRAKATVTPNIRGISGEVHILALDIGLDTSLENLPPGNPIAETVKEVAAALRVDRIPACTLKITSTIPIASGMGSGAAVSVAIIRALAGFLGRPLLDEQISALAYQIEKIHHGTPSGIDNTVVTYAKPVFFVKRLPSPPGRGVRGEGRGEGAIIETFKIAKPFTIVIGDTGIQASTKESVGDVRAAWQSDPGRYNRLFTAVGSITRAARQFIEGGFPDRLGSLMNENHELLQEMGVSSPELDRLVDVAKEAGALGAKLSGGGRGGNMIALAKVEAADLIAMAMQRSGAVRTTVTRISN